MILRIKKLCMLNTLVMFLVVFSFLVMAPINAEAVSMGPYVDVAGGSGTLEHDTGTIIFEDDIETSSSAVGFALETSPLGPSNFSYRLNVGFEGQELEYEDSIFALDLGGIYCENIFAFAFVQNKNLRWWGGPLVRFGFYSGESDTFGGLREDHDYFQFGVGLATGMNFKVGPALILTPSVGVRFMGAGGTAELVDASSGVVLDEADTSASFTNVFVNFALLF